MAVPSDIYHWWQLLDSEEGVSKYCGYAAFISDESGNYLDDDTKTIRFQKDYHEFTVDALMDFEKKISERSYPF